MKDTPTDATPIIGNTSELATALEAVYGEEASEVDPALAEMQLAAIVNEV